MGTNRKRDSLTGALEAGRRRLERWRQTHPARTRIPEALWAAAVKMARKYGVHRTAKALRLDYYSVKKRIEQKAGGAGEVRTESAAATFLELPAALRDGSCECTVELEDSGGAKMRVHLKGSSVPDLAALSRSFWNPAS